jgi:hypothetical protein
MINAQEIAELIDDMLKDLLKEKVYPYGHPQFGVGNKVASGSLLNSIEVNVIRQNSNIAIELFANDYFQWVQSGRLPGKKGVPISDIMAWMRYRGISASDTTNQKYGALQSQVATAYIINKSRIKKGMKPLPMDIVLKWIKDKNIKFNIDLQQGMAYGIQKNIKKFGIRASNIEDKLYEQLASNEQITELLGDLAFEDLVNRIEYNLTANTK